MNRLCLGLEYLVIRPACRASSPADSGRSRPALRLDLFSTVHLQLFVTVSNIFKIDARLQLNNKIKFLNHKMDHLGCLRICFYTALVCYIPKHSRWIISVDAQSASNSVVTTLLPVSISNVPLRRDNVFLMLMTACKSVDYVVVYDAVSATSLCVATSASAEKCSYSWRNKGEFFINLTLLVALAAEALAIVTVTRTLYTDDNVRSAESGATIFSPHGRPKLCNTHKLRQWCQFSPLVGSDLLSPPFPSPSPFPFPFSCPLGIRGLALGKFFYLSVACTRVFAHFNFKKSTLTHRVFTIVAIFKWSP